MTWTPRLIDYSSRTARVFLGHANPAVAPPLQQYWKTRPAAYETELQVRVRKSCFVVSRHACCAMPVPDRGLWTRCACPRLHGQVRLGQVRGHIRRRRHSAIAIGPRSTRRPRDAPVPVPVRGQPPPRMTSNPHPAFNEVAALEK
jgi:hypothetical protein